MNFRSLLQRVLTLIKCTNYRPTAASSQNAGAVFTHYKDML